MNIRSWYKKQLYDHLDYYFTGSFPNEPISPSFLFTKEFISTVMIMNIIYNTAFL